VYHFRECTCYDEREVALEVKDWTKKLYRSIGKSGGKEEYDHLRSVVEDILTQSEKTYDPDWDRLDLKKKWEEGQVTDLVARTGIPKDECSSLLHWGRIARLDKTEDDRKYQDFRREVYERLLQENKHVVTLSK